MTNMIDPINESYYTLALQGDGGEQAYFQDRFDTLSSAQEVASQLLSDTHSNIHTIIVWRQSKHCMGVLTRADEKRKDEGAGQ